MRSGADPVINPIGSEGNTEKWPSELRASRAPIQPNLRRPVRTRAPSNPSILFLLGRGGSTAEASKGYESWAEKHPLPKARAINRDNVLQNG
jgi:hypothetical protein